MHFAETELKGAHVVHLQRFEDDRGFFARAWCRQEFQRFGLNPEMAQLNVGFSHKRGTIRGMHFQVFPHAEAKYVRCTRGAIFDVIIDLRETSPTFKRWIGIELTAENGLSVYAPEGFAHGYQTLCDEAEMCYMTSAAYVPGSARGVRWNDPAFNIDWPLPAGPVSDQDRNWPDFSAKELGAFGLRTHNTAGGLPAGVDAAADQERGRAT
jgi:dTDP-4-dehydrorhamnose 3,5-epimerase